jgi:hypothetical protein
MFLPHYPAQLKKAAADTAAQRAQPSHPPSLRHRFVAQYGSVPSVSRERRFAMSELAVALKYISPVLMELGVGERRKTGYGARQQVSPIW